MIAYNLTMFSSVMTTILSIFSDLPQSLPRDLVKNVSTGGPFEATPAYYSGVRTEKLIGLSVTSISRTLTEVVIFSLGM